MAKNLNEFAADKTDQEAVQSDAERLMREVNKLKALNSDLVRDNKELDDLRRRLSLVGALENANLKPPKWMATKRSRSEHRATICLMLSDLHFDEVVEPAQVDWSNAYNREIATKRLRRWTENIIELAREYFTGLSYDGVVLMLGGDIMSGIIHEELRETNEAPILAGMLYWEEQLCAAIDRIATEFGNVHIPCTYGNHGRRTLKPVAKMRAQDSFEWLMYHHLARWFRDTKTITWQIPDAADCQFSVYGTRYLLTHGDQFRGGSGIAGALSPLLLGSHRKTRRQMALNKPYDVMVVGHWHQLLSLPSRGLIVNGAMKGYDEFAYVSNFESEPPQQAMWLTTPEHGISFTAPIFCANREDEGW